MSKPDERPANPFQRLRDRLGPLPPGPAPAEAPTPKVAGFPHAKERATVRFERAGHGGKTVTRVEGPALRAANLDELAKELARALGVGARAEGGEVLVQGDQCARLVEWLTRRGFGNVQRGN
jgi:translation initiation factor 1 (eIF-1/SUI1)